MIRRIAAVCTAAACLFTVAACGDSSTPKAGTSSVPSYAAGNDQHGAQEFASYWIDTLNKATVTGKTARLKSLALDSCVTCTDFAKQLDTIYGAGGHVSTAGWDVQTVVPETGLPQGQTGVSVKVQVAPQTVVKSKGAKAEQHDGGQLRIRLVLTRSADAWAVKTLDIG